MTVIPRSSPRDRLFSGGLSMHMQPIVDLQTGLLNRVEALARLNLADGTVMYPDDFLPPLTASELDRLFREGLDQSLAYLASWDALGVEVTVSVNVAPATLLHADCLRWVSEALQRHAIEPRRLELELLESQTMNQSGQRDVVEHLLEIGVGLAMDDLGSGYSSLKRLATLPFRSIKLDRDLLVDIRRRPTETLSLIATLRQLGRDFGVTVVVEGLEDEGMAEAATVLGVALGQGYFLARPMPPEAVPDWIASYRYPLRAGTIVTNLGALAYHWQYSRWDWPHLATLHECPLTAYLTKALTGTGTGTGTTGTATDAAAVRRWHALQHSGDGSHLVAGQQLVDWLVQRVRAEGAPDAGWDAASTRRIADFGS
ncbi:EAL domain-containing protein [Cryobacterium frigoriphilum]|uniref:EAL domain-containing protein n=1 Tax=Cryobacterium frigoriphilum TaxID=1259150 RepID=A0A4R9A7X0_9MICO|nr:EAL domain-containing protein [Cryobacterium frigoriphilum]TFD53969.1 EAL domain-containing protein [Cryobacterium frigoriphilum]